MGSPEGLNFRSYEEATEAANLRVYLRELFINQSNKTISLTDLGDYRHPQETFLGGRLETDDGGSVNIDVATWSYSGGVENATVSIYPKQYLINYYGISLESSPTEPLDNPAILELEELVGPSSKVQWQKSYSRRLANHQLELHNMLDRQV